MTITTLDKERQEIDHIKALVTIAVKSGQYPGISEAALMNIALSARDLGVSPYKAFNGGFYVVNGKICMSTNLMADRIRAAGHSIKIPEWTAEKCVIIGVRKDNGDSVKFEFTMDDAQRAGLSNSPTWKKFPKQMLYNRAMSTLARTLFPDVVGNAYSEDEKHDIANVPAEKRPLEDPDVIECNHTMCLSEEQCAKLDLLLSEDEEASELLAKKYGNIYEMPLADFDKAISWIKERKTKRELTSE